MVRRFGDALPWRGLTARDHSSAGATDIYSQVEHGDGNREIMEDHVSSSSEERRARISSSEETSFTKNDPSTPAHQMRQPPAETDAENTTSQLIQLVEILLSLAQQGQSLRALSDELINNNGLSLHTIITFLQSQEFRRVYDERSSPTPHLMRDDDAREVASALFFTILGRYPDKQALDAFGSALKSGQITVLTMIQELASSTEYNKRLEGFNVSEASCREVASELFRVVLGREIDVEALEAYSSSLYAKVISNVEMTRELLGSDEFAERVFRHPEFGEKVLRVVLKALGHTDPSILELDVYAEALLKGRGLAEALDANLNSIKEMVDTRALSYNTYSAMFKVFSAVERGDAYTGSAPFMSLGLEGNLSVEELVGPLVIYHQARHADAS